MNPTPFNHQAVISALFLPLLYWTGAVVAVSLFGYPGVVCVTPAAWLLALPVGLRVRRELHSTRPGKTLEAAVAGGVLGFWQGALVTPFLLGQDIDIGVLNPIFAAGLMILAGVLVGAGLSAAATFFTQEAE